MASHHHQKHSGLKKINDSVHSFMHGIVKGEATGYRMPEFRVSALPYCPILMTLATPEGKMEYKSDYYFSTGTSIHELIQKWASRATYQPRLWGCWRCTGCEVFLSDADLQRKRPPGFKPEAPCPNCAAKERPRSHLIEWQYTEVTIEWLGLGGHVDTILEISPGNFTVVDYKTTDFKFGGNMADRKKFPYKVNTFQVQGYCTLLRELFKLKIVGWCLVYIHRGKPMSGPASYHLSSGEWDRDKHRDMLNILRWANTANINATKIRDRHLAGKRIGRSEMRQVVEERPCTSHRSWRSWMAAAFTYAETKVDGKGVCPHLEVCCGKDTNKIVRHFRTILNEPVENGVDQGNGALVNSLASEVV